MTWRSPHFDLASDLFVPQLISWDPETGEFRSVEGPKGFEMWAEAEEAGRFLRIAIVIDPRARARPF